MKTFRQRGRWWLGGGVVLLLFIVVLWRANPPAAAKPSSVPFKNPFLPEGANDVGWPFIRGAAYDGHSVEINLTQSWPETGPPVLWSRSLGQGYSAFVAKDDRVYTQTQTLAGQSVVCLHADTGETIWEYRYDWPYDAAGVYPGPRATPTLYRNHVYFASPSGVIGCLNAETGRPVWSVNVLEKYQGKGTDFGYSCSPTVLEGRVLLPVGGQGASMVALSADDGSELWRNGDDSASYTPAFPIEYAGQKLVIGYLENALVGWERERGKLVWREYLSHGYDEHSAWPIYREPHLWTSGPFRGGSSLRELSGETEKRLRMVWSSEILSNDVMSSVLVGDHLYGFDIRDAQAKTHRTSRGVFRCIEWKTGKPVWTIGDEKQRPERLSAERTTIGHASVIAANGKLILLNDTGELILARANPDRYEELARAPILSGEIGWTPPILHRGRIYARNHSQAICVYVGRLDLLEGSLRERSKTIDELPQSAYRDWASLLLPIEPEYAFDIPSQRWLIAWFVWSLGILAVGWFVAILVFYGARCRITVTAARGIALGLALVGGALGTPLLSRWREDFVFTWPLTLFAVFHLGALRLPATRRDMSRTTGWQSLAAGLILAAAAGFYFWLCRRLSLVFEWAFLAGLLPALLFVLLDGAASHRHAPTWQKIGAAWLATTLGFAAFYWSSVALLWLRY